MPANTPACPPYSTQLLRLAAVPAEAVILGEDGVTITRDVWWFAAPGHRDLWVAIGRTASRSAADGRALAKGQNLRAVRRRAFLHGVPYAVVAAGPQPVAELQLLAREGMRADIRRHLSGPRAQVNRLRRRLLTPALTAPRSTTHANPTHQPEVTHHELQDPQPRQRRRRPGRAAPDVLAHRPRPHRPSPRPQRALRLRAARRRHPVLPGRTPRDPRTARLGRRQPPGRGHRGSARRRRARRPL